MRWGHVARRFWLAAVLGVLLVGVLISDAVENHQFRRLEEDVRRSIPVGTGREAAEQALRSAGLVPVWDESHQKWFCFVRTRLPLGYLLDRVLTLRVEMADGRVVRIESHVSYGQCF